MSTPRMNSCVYTNTNMCVCVCACVCVCVCVYVFKSTNAHLPPPLTHLELLTSHVSPLEATNRSIFYFYFYLICFYLELLTRHVPPLQATNRSVLKFVLCGDTHIHTHTHTHTHTCIDGGFGPFISSTPVDIYKRTY